MKTLLKLIIIIIIIIIVIIIIIIILYLPTCHLGAESLFKREPETNYKKRIMKLIRTMINDKKNIVKLCDI